MPVESREYAVDVADTRGVPVLEIRDESESKSKMPEEFRKWFNLLWNRRWSDAPREETVEEMWTHLVSQGFPKDAFYDECLRRGIIIGGDCA